MRPWKDLQNLGYLLLAKEYGMPINLNYMTFWKKRKNYRHANNTSR